MFFGGAHISKSDHLIRARVRLENGKHRLSRAAFDDIGAALNWGTRWVKRARRILGRG